MFEVLVLVGLGVFGWFVLQIVRQRSDAAPSRPTPAPQPPLPPQFVRAPSDLVGTRVLISHPLVRRTAERAAAHGNKYVARDGDKVYFVLDAIEEEERSRARVNPSFDEFGSVSPAARRVLLRVGLLAVGSLVSLLPLSAQQGSDAYTAPCQRKALEIYRTLVGMRTAAGQGQVPKAAGYLADHFRAAGFPADDVHVLPFKVASGEETAGLVVRYRGDGSSGKKPILLLAHMDVVDALRADWDRDPFTLVEEDGYFFGRGSVDNKFGVTSLTATFLRLKAEGFVPTRDLIIAFTGDEETGMISARRMVTEHRALTDAEFALNDDGGGGNLDEAGRPVAFFVQTAEKTYATFELTVTNPGGHSSTPRADDNAIYDLTRALVRLEAYGFPVQTTEATQLFFPEMAKVMPGPVGEAMSRCVPTLLRAGHAENVLPQSAVATVNCRMFPGVEVAEVQKELGRVADTPGLAVKVLDTPTASPVSPLRDDVMEAVTAAVHARYPGTPVIPYMAPYGTDGRETRGAGISTFGVMGLFIKDSDQFAQGLNERVPVEQFFGALEY